MGGDELGLVDGEALVGDVVGSEHDP
jgi:hypothetical protein